MQHLTIQRLGSFPYQHQYEAHMVLQTVKNPDTVLSGLHDQTKPGTIQKYPKNQTETRRIPNPKI